jgi:hypothetical protein
MELQNIKIVDETYRGKVYTPTVNPMLANLLYKVATDHPQWEFTNSHNRQFRNEDGTDRLEAMRFDITQNKQDVGQIGIDGWGDSKKYWVSNERISINSSRGYGRKTQDLTKALKLIKKFFTELTIEEVMLKAYEKSERVVHNTRSTKHWALRHSLDMVRDEMIQYMADNWEEMKEKLPSASTAGNFPKLYSEHEIMMSMQDALKRGTACLVQTMNDTYTFKYGDKEAVTSMTSEQLPNNVRLSIGMLKLLEPEQAIENMGFKITNELFVVMNPKGEQSEQATK